MNTQSLRSAALVISTIVALWLVTSCGGGEGKGTTSGESPAADGLSGMFAAPPPDDPLGDWRPRFEAMADALNLQGADRDRLADAFLNRDRELRAWLDSADGRRFLRLEAELREATADRDLNRVRTVTGEAGPLRRHFEQLIESSERDLLASLSPGLRDRWAAHRLYTRLADFMDPLGLSPDQQSALAERAGYFLRLAREGGEPNPDAAAFLEFERWAEGSVLEPDQQAMYEGIKRANPMRSLRR
jgi:hypothetical protein